MANQSAPLAPGKMQQMADSTKQAFKKPVNQEDGLAAHLSNIWDKLYGRKPLAEEVTDQTQQMLNKKKKKQPGDASAEAAPIEDANPDQQ